MPSNRSLRSILIEPMFSAGARETIDRTRVVSSVCPLRMSGGRKEEGEESWAGSLYSISKDREIVRFWYVIV